MKMNLMIATAILAWCDAIEAAALPQAPSLATLLLATSTAVTGGLAAPNPLVPGIPLPPLPIPSAVGPPSPPSPPVLPVPVSIPNLSSPLPKLPVVSLPVEIPVPVVSKLPGPGDVPKLPPITLPTDPDSINSYVQVGKIVLQNLLSLLWQGASVAKIPGLNIPGVAVSAVPSVNTTSTLPIVAAPPLKKRQVVPPVLSSVRPPTATTVPSLGGLLGTVTGVTNNIPVVGGVVSGVSGAVGGLASNVPVSGVLASPLPVASGLVSGLNGGDVLGTVGSDAAPVVGGVVAPVASAVGAVASGVASGNPNAAVQGAVGAINSAGSAVQGAVNSAGSAAQGVVNTVGSAINSAILAPYPINQGVPGSDPIGGLSISIIATLLSLLKKDPLSLFGGGLGGIGGLVKRDLPGLADAFEIEKRELEDALEKRQFGLPPFGLPSVPLPPVPLPPVPLPPVALPPVGLPPVALPAAPLPGVTLPSLSTGVSGVGIGALPLSGIPGVSPDLAFLVGSIAKNIAVPGGKGLGSVTGNILTVLNGVVPNFLFKLPVVYDSVPTFGALQLLSAINPAKFGALNDLTTLAALSQASASITPTDLAFIKTLPVSTDPTNLITTITTLTDNILSLPGNVANLKAAVSVLCLRNLGLAVPGL